VSTLQDTVALVTGASRGIGAAIATLFAAEGAAVAIHGRDVAALTAVRADIARSVGKAIQVTADVTRFAEIEQMRRQVEGELGSVDILVANAGGSRTKPRPLEDTSEEEWRLV
jgi:3-oxoacyl-[acyl-carrier protein] reductase